MTMLPEEVRRQSGTRRRRDDSSEKPAAAEFRASCAAPGSAEVDAALQCAVDACLASFPMWFVGTCRPTCFAPVATAAGPARLKSLAPHLFKFYGEYLDRYTWTELDEANLTVACRLLQIVPRTVGEICVTGRHQDAARLLFLAYHTRQPLRVLHVFAGAWHSKIVTEIVTALLQTTGHKTLQHATLECIKKWTPALTAALKGCAHLESLDWTTLPDCRFGDFLPVNLRALTLRGVVDGEGLEAIAAALPHLRSLSIGRIGLNRDAAVRALAFLLPRLDRLELLGALHGDFVALTDALQATICADYSPLPLPLRILALVEGGDDRVDAEFLKLLADRAPLIEELSLDHPPRHGVMSRFKRCVSLTARRRRKVTDEDVARLLSAMPQLRALAIPGRNRVTFDPAVYAEYRGALNHKLRSLRVDVDDDASTTDALDRAVAIFPRLRRLRDANRQDCY